MKIERKFMAHYIDASSTSTASYELLGKDLEEYTVEMNATVETKANILGNNSTNLSGYEPSASVEPYIAESGTALFTRLQAIVDERKVLDELKTTVVEVHLWEEATSGTYPAYREEAIIEVKRYGGDTNGYQIPFDLHYIGSRVSGTFDPSSKTFTASATASE